MNIATWEQSRIHAKTEVGTEKPRVDGPRKDTLGRSEHQS